MLQSTIYSLRKDLYLGEGVDDTIVLLKCPLSDYNLIKYTDTRELLKYML